MIRIVRALLATLVIAALPGVSTAQTLGTYKWQLQPYCNIVSVTVTQVGGVYRVEGTDDRCGASQAASVIGTAFMNADGSIGMGLNIVAVPNGQPQPLSAVLSLTTLSGTWSDAGSNGSFVFTMAAAMAATRGPSPMTRR